MAKIINPFAENEKLLHLEEMSEAISASMSNLESVIEQQELLIKVVEDSEFKDKFEEFIKESNEQLDNLKHQRETLTLKKSRIDDLIECSKNEESLNVMLKVFEAFGIFN